MSSQGGLLPRDADVALAAASSAAVGSGLVFAAAGAASGQLGLALPGVALATAALLVLLAAGWLDALLLVVLALSVPAPWSSDALRVAPAAAATGLAITAWLVHSTIHRRPIDPGDVPLRAAAALFLAVLLAAAFAAARGTALREVVNWGLLLALLVVAADQLARRPDRRRRLALAIALVMAATGCAAVLQFAGVLPARFQWGQGVVRATAGFGWPNELGMFLALGVPFAVYAIARASSRSARALALAGLAATLAGLAASFSRGSWVAVLLGSLPLLFVGRGRQVLQIWAGAALALLLAAFATGGIVLTRVASTGSDWVVGQRIALTLSGLEMARDHPLLGVGPGGFGTSLVGFAARISQLWDLTGSAQNAYVQFAAETGFIGLAAYLWFLGAILARLLRGAHHPHSESLRGARGRSDPSAAAPPTAASDADLALRGALLWSASTLCFLGFFEWPFAHGVAELVMLVAALGCARW